MSWQQVVKFDLSKMGKSKNFCLRNVRQAYGIGSKYANAKGAMNENNKKGALHPLSTIPTNVAVPVYSAQGLWGHVEVCDRGTYYSDGKKVGKPNASFEWGEYINGVQVVRWVDSPKPSSIKVGDTVKVTGQGTGDSFGGGGSTKVFHGRKMKVVYINNGRYGCNQYNTMGAVTGWFTSSQVEKV